MAFSDSAPASASGPRPDLTPGEVVAIQLAALRRNDVPFPDTGAAIAFRFASPESRASCGPLPRFIRMLHGPLYRPLLGFESAEVSAVRLGEDLAQQCVTVIPAADEDHAGAVVYRFTLTRQIDGPYAGCWLTDGVVPEVGGGEGLSSSGPAPKLL